MEKNSEKGETTFETPPGFGLGYRHLLAVLMFLCLVIAYGLRVNMSVAVVAMTDVNSTLDFPTYDWTRKEQNFILSSFFWGYVITQVPAASIGQRWGPHYPLGIAMILCSIAAMLTPLAAHYGPGAVEGVRIVQGLTQGFCFPSLHNLCSKWVPKNERGRLVTFIYAGAQLGTVIFLSLSGVIGSSAKLGWPAIFYCCGIIGVIWGVVWLIFGGNSPTEYKYISKEELKYIEASMGEQGVAKKIPTPWLALLTSLPFWALIIAHCTNNWGFWTLLTEMPTYMKDILDYDIKQSGWSSSLPYLTMWLLSFVFSFTSDFIINRKILSTTVSRKIYNTIGIWIPAGALVALGYAQHQVLALTLLVVAVGFNSATYVGFQVNHIDLAPNHAGTMMGITNCLANIMSILGPLVVGFIVDDKDPTIEEWRLVFFIASIVYFFGNLFYMIFGSAKLQPWNDEKEPINTVTVQDFRKIEDNDTNRV